jgi:hypothetical protein
MVSESTPPTKSELLAALRSSGEELLTKLRALPPERLEDGRYEGGWNARQILAHVASIEWTYPRLLDIARGAASPSKAAGAEARRTTPEGDPGLPTRPARGGINDYNQRQVDKRAGASVDELLDEFAQNRAATIAAVAGADETLLQTPIRSAGGITGPLAGVLNAVAVLHITAHLRDIVGDG